MTVTYQIAVGPTANGERYVAEFYGERDDRLGAPAGTGVPLAFGAGIADTAAEAVKLLRLLADDIEQKAADAAAINSRRSGTIERFTTCPATLVPFPRPIPAPFPAVRS